MEDKTTQYDVHLEPASRPGLKTLGFVIIVAITVFSFFNWTAVKAAIDFL